MPHSRSITPHQHVGFNNFPLLRLQIATVCRLFHPARSSLNTNNRHSANLPHLPHLTHITLNRQIILHHHLIISNGTTPCQTQTHKFFPNLKDLSPTTLNKPATSFNCPSNSRMATPKSGTTTPTQFHDRWKHDGQDVLQIHPIPKT
jgi:hypothetical protein